ncbi:uncharacterized protein LOC111518915 [Drosophila willistoni]|uniref:uncharacterized protein LOC111518915 n=1 Tax=Drosophila willistoni TaxID=7260 RepID=UPI001F07C4C4|nr:uncharacterized protein LOC111518915 [Drosophila willistoni]
MFAYKVQSVHQLLPAHHQTRVTYAQAILNFDTEVDDFSTKIQMSDEAHFHLSGDGIGDGQLNLCSQYEIPQFEAIFGNRVKITFIIVQKRINTRFFLLKNNATRTTLQTIRKLTDGELLEDLAATYEMRPNVLHRNRARVIKTRFKRNHPIFCITIRPWCWRSAYSVADFPAVRHQLRKHCAVERLTLKSMGPHETLPGVAGPGAPVLPRISPL